MTEFKNGVYDEERAFYGAQNVILKDCSFDGPADGESALKEARNIEASNVYFNLRYPCWHDENLRLVDCDMTELCRAALWYSEDILIKNSKLHGIKALRECKNVKIEDTDIISPEFGWSVDHIELNRSEATSEYFMLRSSNLKFDEVTLHGKYSFQYIENAEFTNCNFDTKDAFWHSKNVTVRDSVVKGEYLAWYSEGLTLIHCKIIGTQPLCYCKNLTLIDCEMIDTDLSFEKSEVQATLTAPILSIKNPLSGSIKVPAVGEIIMDEDWAKGTVLVGDI